MATDKDPTMVRDEIKTIIMKSGTTDKETTKTNYKDMLKMMRDLSDDKTEKLVQDEDTIEGLIHQIVLADMNISDDEILGIAQMIAKEKPKTRKIFMSHNKITDKGATVLAHEFSKLPDLHYLDLQANQIDEQGFEALYEWQAKNPELDFSMRGNKLEDIGKIYDIKCLAFYGKKIRRQIC